MGNVRQTAFDIVHRLRAARSHGDLHAELVQAGRVFGYDAFLVAGLPRGSDDDYEQCKLVSGWAPEWEQRYFRKHFVTIDPVIARIRGTADPFLWSDAASLASAKPGLIVMQEARAFGLNEGLCVPFHQLDGTEAGVSFGGQQVRLSHDERAGLHLVAIYAMSAAKAIARRRAEAEGDDPPASPLTKREIECVRWAAAGKSAWEISVILTISERTAAQHLASAGRKLLAVTRTQCVAEALRRGIID